MSAMPHALLAAAAPRAIGGSVQGSSADPATMLTQIHAAFNDFRDRYDRRQDELEAAISDRMSRDALASIGGGVFGAASGAVAVDREYTELFASFVRNGGGEADVRKANAEGFRAQINAALSTGTASDGGYLAPVEWDREVRKRQVAISPLRRLARVENTGVGAFTTVWNNGTWGTGWVGESAARPATSTAELATLEFAAGEIYSNVPITQRLLDDAQFNVEAWLATEISTEFARQEAIAFISGNGVNKPFGFLSYVTGGAADGRHPGGNLEVSTMASATVITADELVDFVYSLTAPYRVGATWLMNSATAARLAKLKDGDGNFLWREAFTAGQPATLLGYPVEIDEGMPNVAAGAHAIAFGDFSRGYLINDRFGTRLLRDPYTNKPFVMFYSTKRVGGGLLDPSAIRLLRMAVS